jgi:hypothetical protein
MPKDRHKHTRQIHLRLSDCDYDALQRRALRNGEPVTSLIRRILRSILQREDPRRQATATTVGHGESTLD